MRILPPAKRGLLFGTLTMIQNSSMGLAMIGAGKKLRTPVEDNDANQRYDAVQNAGGGVNVYVMDSGIRLSHPLFDGRASNFNNLKPPQAGANLATPSGGA